MEYVLIFFCGVLFWFKSNAKIVFELYWEPWEWWLYTGLLSNYMSLYGWWGLIEKYDVWHATAIWVLLTTFAEVILNCMCFEYSLAKIIGVMFCILGAYISSL